MKQTAASLRRVISVALHLVVTLTSLWQPIIAAPPNADLVEGGDQTISLWRIDFDDEAQLNVLAARLDIWEVHHAAGYVVAPLTAAQQALLALEGRRVQRDGRIVDVQLPELEPALSSLDAIPGFLCYRTVEKTERDLAALALQHPDFAVWLDIGDSWDKSHPGAPDGYDIHALVLTNRQSTAPKFRFLLTGAIHAREYVTAEMAARYAKYLLSNYGVDPDVTWLLDYGEIHIIPFANPDGRKFAERGYYWRKNTNNVDECSDWYGVDLNRNSSFNWGACEGPNCSSGDACADTYRGSAPASEPETQAVQTYAHAIFPDQRSDVPSDAVSDAASGLFISLHSYGGLVMFPWGWSASPSGNNAALRALGDRLAAPLGYKSCQAGEWGCLYQTDGGAEDWMYGELGVAAYTIELGSTFFESCSVFEDEMLPNAFATLTAAFMAARQPYRLALAPDITALHAAPQRIVAGMPVTVTAAVGAASSCTDTRQVMLRSGIDLPSWASGAAIVTATHSVADLGASAASPVTLTARVDTSAWLPGRHLLWVEAVEGENLTGSPRTAWIDVVEDGIKFKAQTSADSAHAQPGTAATYTVTISNTGLLADSYAGSVEDSLWPAQASVISVTVSAGAAGSVQVRVEVPAKTKPGEADDTRLHLVSLTEPDSQQLITLHTVAGNYLYYYPLYFLP